MQTLHNRLAALLALVACAATLGAGMAQATTYSYTGALYASPTGTFTTSMRLSGSFTTASPLPANMPLTNIGPGGSNLVTSWSFSTGLYTLTQANSILLYGEPSFFAVSTDASGSIDDYQIGLMSPLPPNTVGEPMNSLVFSKDDFYEIGNNIPCIEVVGDVCSGILTSGGDGAVEEPESGSFGPPPRAAVDVPTLSTLSICALALLLGAGTLLARARRGAW